MSLFLQVKSLGGCNRVLCYGSYKAVIKVLAQLGSYPAVGKESSSKFFTQVLARFSSLHL